MTQNSTASGSIASGSTAGSTQQVSLPTFTSHVPPPGRLELKGKLSDNWKKWKQVWDAYETVTKLDEKESKFRVATFITCTGAKALEVHTQHEIMNLRIFMLCVKIRKCEIFSIRSNSAMRKGP